MSTKKDEELLNRFHLMTDDEMDFYLLSFRVCTKDREKKKPEKSPGKRPELKLLLGGASLSLIDKRRSGLG